MKKLVLTLAIAAIAAITAIAQEQAYKFPGWACTDVAQFQAQLPLAPTPQQKSEVAYMIAMLQAPPADYAAARQIIDAAIDQHYPDASPAVRLVAKKKYALVTRKWTADLLAYCQTNPCAYDIYVASRFPSPWSAQRLQECLLTDIKSNTPEVVSPAITALNAYAIKGDLTAEEAKAAFANLDLFYTAKLADDKDKWAPVVAKIRTIREVYK